MRKTFRAFLMVLALCCPAFAGEMLCPSVAPPPPQSAQEATMNGVMTCPSLAEVVLTLFTLV